jgi:Ca2+-binding RTX toxin-like protein
MGTYVSISGGSDASVRIYGDGTVVAGSGNDSIRIDGNGQISVGAGDDHLTLRGSGGIYQHGAGGSDTINLGSGRDTITEAGRATVYGSGGSAIIHGGTVEFGRVGAGGSDNDHDHDRGHGYGHDDSREHGSSQWLDARGDRDGWRQSDGHGGHGGDGSHSYYDMTAVSGNATLLGGSHATQFVGGTGNVVMQGGTSNDTFVGGSGHATMTGGSGPNLFEFTSQGVGGTDVITNFVSGQDHLYLEGQSLSYLQSQGDVTMSHGNTYISLDGGKTTIELKGFTGLSGHDVTTHKG